MLGSEGVRGIRHGISLARIRHCVGVLGATTKPEQMEQTDFVPHTESDISLTYSFLGNNSTLSCSGSFNSCVTTDGGTHGETWSKLPRQNDPRCSCISLYVVSHPSSIAPSLIIDRPPSAFVPLLCSHNHEPRSTAAARSSTEILLQSETFCRIPPRAPDAGSKICFRRTTARTSVGCAAAQPGVVSEDTHSRGRRLYRVLDLFHGMRSMGLHTHDLS